MIKLLTHHSIKESDLCNLMKHWQQLMQLGSYRAKPCQELGLKFLQQKSFLKIFNNGSPNYPTFIISTTILYYSNRSYHTIILLPNRFYHTRHCERVLNFRVNHNFFKNSCFPSTISDFNKLDFWILFRKHFHL